MYVTYKTYIYVIYNLQVIKFYIYINIYIYIIYIYIYAI